MKALVLSGGGSKGSYQIGVWKALRKLNYKYKIITGTSAGALNGALMTQKTYSKAINLWKKINFDLIFEEDIIETKNNLELYKMYGKNFIKNGGMNVNKLEELLHKTLDKNAFYKSNINFGLTTYNLSQKKAKELQKHEIPKDQIVDYLIASATCYPAFQKKEIEGEHYIDGGYHDNLPINLAMKMGATEIIAVDLHSPGIKKEPKRKNIKITLISPNNKLTNFLDFNNEGAKRNIKFGYNDTMKKFNKLEGKKYTFKKGSLKKNRKTYQETYEHILKKVLNSKKLMKEYKRIMKIAKINTKTLKEEAFDNIMEYTGKSFNLDETKIYTNKSFNKKLKQEVQKALKNNKQNNSILNIKKSEIELFIKLKNHEYNDLRKEAILNLPELLRAIYLFTLFEA